jgi:hypothetical protein
MKFSLLLALLGVLLFVAACGPDPQVRNDRFLRDNSLITGEPCGPPCWRGITPGETSWGDALIALEDDSSITDLQTRTDDSTGSRGAAWAQVDGDGCCQMFSEEGARVDFLILQTAPTMRLGQVIDVHGEPDYLVGEVLPGDSEQGIFSLFYTDVPMLVYAFIAGEEGSLSASSEIVGYAYMTGELMEFLLETSSLHGWQGYLPYGDYVVSDFVVTPSVTVTPVDE